MLVGVTASMEERWANPSSDARGAREHRRGVFETNHALVEEIVGEGPELVVEKVELVHAIDDSTRDAFSGVELKVS